MSIQSSFNSALSSISQLYQLKKMAKAAEKGEKRASAVEHAQYAASNPNMEKVVAEKPDMPNSWKLKKKFPEFRTPGNPEETNPSSSEASLNVLDRRASGDPVGPRVMRGLRSYTQAPTGVIAASLTQEPVHPTASSEFVQSFMAGVTPEYGVRERIGGQQDV